MSLQTQYNHSYEKLSCSTLYFLISIGTVNHSDLKKFITLDLIETLNQDQKIQAMLTFR